MADICMGFVYVNFVIAPQWYIFLCLLLASSLLYTAGMVLNDVFDVEVDRRDRPHRPLASGQIALGRARVLGFAMLVLGVALAFLAGALAPADAPYAWRSGAVAVLLAVCIVLYDGVLKTTPAAPLVMGSCRFLNVLLGMSIVSAANRDLWHLAGYHADQLLAAGGLGVYIVGVTLFARNEAKAEISRWRLAAGVAVMLFGFAMLACVPHFGEFATGQRNLQFYVAGVASETVWPLLLLLLAFTIVRRCLIAVRQPEPPLVQAAVKHAILSLIVIDAAVLLAVSGNGYAALGTLALLMPTLLLGKWVYST